MQFRSFSKTQYFVFSLTLPISTSCLPLNKSSNYTAAIFTIASHNKPKAFCITYHVPEVFRKLSDFKYVP